MMSGPPDHPPGWRWRPLWHGAGLALVVLLGTLPFLQTGTSETVASWSAFLGRFHPVVLHFPIVLLLLCAFFELARLPVLRRILPQVPEETGFFLLAAGSLSAAVAAVLGWLLSQGGGYDEAFLRDHLRLGLGVAIGSILACLSLDLARRAPRPAAWRGIHRAVLLVTAGATLAAGHAGGKLTHGGDFLTERAPAPVRRLLGLPVPGEEPLLPLADRLAFRDVVRPVLADRCAACHGDAKAMGGLRLTSPAAIVKGGESGPGAVAGRPGESHILRRIRLPDGDPKRMPPAGKPGLVEGETAILEWWVAAGLPDDKRLADLDIPPAVRAAIEARIPESQRRALDAARAAQLAKRLADLDRLRAELPGRITVVDPETGGLEYVAGPDAARLDDARLAFLAPLADQFVRLDLAGSAVTAAGLDGLTNLARLAHLNLSGTKPAGPLLARHDLPSLRTLNLTGAAIDDVAVTGLVRQASLKKIHLLQTGVTTSGVAALKAARPGLEIFDKLPEPEP